MKKAAALLLLALAPAVAGCVEAFGDRDPHEPGQSLGTFHIVAKQSKNTCGDGALGAPPVWEFDVKLAWEDDSLFWNSGGQVIPGTLSQDRSSFEIATQVVMNMRTAEDTGKKPCSMLRSDEAEGSLMLEGDAVTAAQGTLTYAYAPTEGSECSDLLSAATPVFAALPCSMEYAFSAPRTGD